MNSLGRSVQGPFVPVHINEAPTGAGATAGAVSVQRPRGAAGAQGPRVPVPRATTTLSPFDRVRRRPPGRALPARA
jgi:hypothetical protein